MTSSNDNIHIVTSFDCGGNSDVKIHIITENYDLADSAYTTVLADVAPGGDNNGCKKLVELTTLPKDKLFRDGCTLYWGAHAVKSSGPLRPNTKKISDTADKLLKDIRSLYCYHKTLSDGDLVTGIVRMHIRQTIPDSGEVYKLSYTDIPCLSSPWDGVLYVPSLEHLYLIDVKMTAEADILHRIRCTVQFVQEVRELPPPVCFYQQWLCKEWSLLVTPNIRVFGVVGGALAEEKAGSSGLSGLLAVFHRDGVYHLQLPQEGEGLMCHVTNQHVRDAIRSAQFTDDEVEDGLIDAYSHLDP